MTRSPAPADADARFDERLENALLTSHALQNAVIDANSKDHIVARIIATYAARLIDVDESTFYMESDEPPLVEASQPSTQPRPMTLTLHVTATGATQALDTASAGVERISTERFSNAPDRTKLVATVAPEEPLTSDQITKIRDAWLDKLAVAVADANERIATEHRRLEESVRAIIEPLHDRRTALVTAAEGVGIPLAPVPSSRVIVPLVPRLLTLDTATAAAERGTPEASLASDIADDLVKMIEAFSRALERMPLTANQLIEQDEESIRDVLLFLLNANWRGTATGETFIGEGKCDILLRWQDRDAFIGECKIWHGDSKFEAGLTQLLERYTVWRATRIAMILFLRGIANPTAIIAKARGVILAHERFVRVIQNDSSEAFEMRAQHDCDRIVTLNLVSVVMPARTPAEG